MKRKKKIISSLVVIGFLVILGVFTSNSIMNVNANDDSEEIKKEIKEKTKDYYEDYDSMYDGIEKTAKEEKWSQTDIDFHKTFNSPMKIIYFNLKDIENENHTLFGYNEGSSSEEILNSIFTDEVISDFKPVVISYIDTDYQLVRYAYVDENFTRYFFDENGEKVVCGIEYKPAYVVPDKGMTVKDFISHVVTGDLNGSYNSYEDDTYKSDVYFTNDHHYEVLYEKQNGKLSLVSLTVDGQYEYSFLEAFPQSEAVDTEGYENKVYYTYKENIHEITKEDMNDLLPEGYN